MFKQAILASLLSCSVATSAIASIISTTGNISVVNVGYDDGGVTRHSTTGATVFSERTNWITYVTELGRLTYEAARPGEFYAPTPKSTFADGLSINSYILELVDATGTPRRAQGTITFGSDKIVGFNTYFDASSNQSAQYIYERTFISLIGHSGLELSANDSNSVSADYLWISPDYHTLTFDLAAGTDGDALRIYTIGNALGDISGVNVPEPATQSLFAIALGVLVLLRRRKS